LAKPISSSRFVPASREELAVMAKRAGLDLSPEHFDQLCDAWKHVEQMIARIPRDRPRLDEPAQTFAPWKEGLSD
jgi:hypothetical protein